MRPDGPSISVDELNPAGSQGASVLNSPRYMSMLWSFTVAVGTCVARPVLADTDDEPDAVEPVAVQDPDDEGHQEPETDDSLQLDLKFAMRVNLFHKSWVIGSDRSKAEFDTIMLGLNASYRQGFTSWQYRFYDGYNMLHHGYFGYRFDDRSEIQVGVHQKPFGLLPYASHNWFFNLTYYCGLEDDYDLGAKLILDRKPLDLQLAYYLRDEGNYYGDSIDSARYSYDIVETDPSELGAAGVTTPRTNKERNQLNARLTWTFEHGKLGSTEIGCSGEWGQIRNEAAGRTGYHWAAAVHLNGNYDQFNLQLQAIRFTNHPENPPGQDDRFIVRGAYDAPYKVAAEGWLFVSNLSYKLPFEIPLFDAITLYTDYSYLLKSESSYSDSQQVVVGTSLAAGPALPSLAGLRLCHGAGGGRPERRLGAAVQHQHRLLFLTDPDRDGAASRGVEARGAAPYIGRSMKLLTLRSGDRTCAGLVCHGEQVVLVEELFSRHFAQPFRILDVGDLLRQDGVKRLKEIDPALAEEDRRMVRPLRDIEIMAPILRPPKIVCVGLNYRDHAEEQNRPVPESPMLFAKAANIVVGHEAKVRIPPEAPDQVDYEVELGVVIGREGYRIPTQEAGEYIFGYTVFNDVTARDVQKADRQFFRGKSFHTFAPMGPVLVTGDDLDPTELNVRMRVNGELRQESNTRNLIFDVRRLVAHVSACFPLEAGDVIATGTPGGVGVFRDPPLFLRAGDVMEAEVQGIGVLRNTLWHIAGQSVVELARRMRATLFALASPGREWSYTRR
jgi:2-keto-4-pentenoate hydratase/2-oxohepta-3-ene-1,7-dioic acid hydratase in catechol pathway